MSIYAIVQILGKQYIVKPNLYYKCLFKEKPNNYLSLHKLLMFSNNKTLQIGKPFLYNCTIKALIVPSSFIKKLTIIKTKPKKNYTRTYGYKENYSLMKIVEY